MEPAAATPSPIPHLGARIALGSLVALFNLKGFLAYIALHWAPWPWLSVPLLALAEFAGRLMGALAGDDVALSGRLAQWVVTGFWWYFAALLLAGLLLWKPLHSAHGVGGLFAGLLWFPITCWIVVIAAAVMWICIRVVGWIYSAIAWVMALFAPLAALLVRVFAFLLPWVALLAAAGAAVWGIVWLVRNLRGKPLLIAVGATVAAGIVYSFLPVLARIWFEVIAPVLAKIGAFLGMVIAAIVPLVGMLLLILLAVAFAIVVLASILGVLGLLGWLVADQFRAAWHGGGGRTAMTFSGVVVGTAIAMVLMVCIGVPEAGAALDAAWRESAWLGRGLSPAATFAAILPDQVRGALAVVLQDATAPVFDGLLLLALFACATLGMFRLGEQKEEIPLGEYLRDGKVFAGLAAAPLLIVAIAVLPSEDS